MCFLLLLKHNSICQYVKAENVKFQHAHSIWPKKFTKASWMWTYIQNRLYVFVFFLPCLKALFHTKTSYLQPLPLSSILSSALLWFSCHYLLIKVENNSPGPGHLFNDKHHSLVCLPAGTWFRDSDRHASAHRTSSFHLTQHWSMWAQRANHFICCLSMCEGVSSISPLGM